MAKYVTSNELEEKFNDFAVKIFRYFDRRFDEVDKRFEQQDARIDSLYNLLDTHMKQTEIYHQEFLVLNHQFDRHDRWIHLLADKTDTQLEY